MNRLHFLQHFSFQAYMHATECKENLTMRVFQKDKQTYTIEYQTHNCAVVLNIRKNLSKYLIKNLYLFLLHNQSAYRTCNLHFLYLDVCTVEYSMSISQ